MRTSALPAAILLALAAAAPVSCFNPGHNDAVDALGGEVNGVEPGPAHRPGQPCLVCHGGDGPGPDFAIGGTIYARRGGDATLGGVAVVLRDANGVERRETSNAAGNFYIPAELWTPKYPLFARLEYPNPNGGNTLTKEMASRIGGNGGCATCHYGADNESTHMPPVYMNDR